MIKVIPKPREPIGVTLKRLRKLVEREGVIKEVKKHAYFETRNQIRRRKKLKAIRRIQNEANTSQPSRSKGNRNTSRTQGRS